LAPWRWCWRWYPRIELSFFLCRYSFGDQGVISQRAYCSFGLAAGSASRLGPYTGRSPTKISSCAQKVRTRARTHPQHTHSAMTVSIQYTRTNLRVPGPEFKSRGKQKYMIAPPLEGGQGKIHGATCGGSLAFRLRKKMHLRAEGDAPNLDLK
jgi:hypothetical protein